MASPDPGQEIHKPYHGTPQSSNFGNTPNVSSTCWSTLMVHRGKGGTSNISPPPPRVVLHVDLDAFFVQVERSLNPTLIGEPMAVQQHADIIAVSYEARRLGVTKHMPPRTIRQQYPSVKLVHVETIGLDNSKVSYRNYRKAARAIFTLVRAFCPSEDGGNSSRGGAGRSAGTFQKTSVDEAYLEPTRRTLEAEVLLSGQARDRTLLECCSAPAKGNRTLLPSPSLAKNNRTLQCSSAPAKDNRISLQRSSASARGAAGQGLNRPLSRSPAKRVVGQGIKRPPSKRSSACDPVAASERLPGQGLKRPLSKISSECGPLEAAERLAGQGLKSTICRKSSGCYPLAGAGGVSGDGDCSAAGGTGSCVLNDGNRHFGEGKKEAGEGGGRAGETRSSSTVRHGYRHFGDDEASEGSASVEGGENALEMAVADSPEDGRPMAWGKRRGGSAAERRARADEEEEDRLLEAGGLLGRRIQKTLSETLNYDCSVGVAGNKFLAKLATNLAKPKGVRVLHRQDISALLASTSVTKIPGCGPGSMAAKQFAAWGAGSMLDLRRIDVGELRERLGEKLGAKVYDRCRGIDSDPVEPDPVPSRVSSQLALVPLISPAYCLGKPGEKPTPVFPWEVERLRNLLATLVDDLIDRAREELVERSRRPTKICLEYHLHQRGSKSQTFVLPPSAPPSRRPPPCSRGEETKQASSVVALQVDAEKGKTVEPAPSVAAPEVEVEKEAGGLLPPADSLVELVLSPFKSYRQSRTLAGGGGGGAHEAGGGTKNHRGNASPPVVKLNVSFLGFVNLGAAAAVSPPPGQRTLRGMAWLGRGAPSTALSMDAPSPALSISGQDGNSSGGDRSSGKSNPDEVSATRAVPGKLFPDEKAAARVQEAPAADSPVDQQASVSPTSAIDGTRADNAALLDGNPPQTGLDGNPRKRGRGDDDPLQAIEGSVLVRCPRCKACLPLGDAWDAHREEHLLVLKHNKLGLRFGETNLVQRFPLGAKMSTLQGRFPSLQPSVVSLSRGAKGLHAPGGDARNEGVGSARYTRPSLIVDGRRAGDGMGDAGGASYRRLRLDVDGGRGEGGRTRLSDLLQRAVSPAQASDVLKERGFLRLDGQTRFAHLGLAEGRQQSAPDE